MNNSIKLKHDWLKPLTYLYWLVFQSWLSILLLITIMSAFKTNVAFKLDANIDFG